MDKNQIAISTYGKIADVYTKQYFTDTADLPYIDQFLEKLPQNGTILDVGCGPGQFAQYMAMKGFQVIGIDYTKEMLAIAKTKVPEVDFRYMDMRNVEFEVNSFDGLLCAYSLIHISSQDIPDTLTGFYRILKPGGYLEIIAQKGEPDRVVTEPFLPSEKMFVNFFTTEALTRFVTNAGFTVIYQKEVRTQDVESMSDTIIYTICQKSF